MIPNIILVFGILIALDLIYLGVIQKQFIGSFFSRVNDNKSLNLKWIPGVLSWIILAWGLYYFVLSRPDWKWTDAALYGLVVYGVYDLTNLATLAKWTLEFAIADMIWGIVLMTLVSVIYKQLKKI